MIVSATTLPHRYDRDYDMPPAALPQRNSGAHAWPALRVARISTYTYFLVLSIAFGTVALATVRTNAC